jgi:hypothetical protein
MTAYHIQSKNTGSKSVGFSYIRSFYLGHGQPESLAILA